MTGMNLRQKETNRKTFMKEPDCARKLNFEIMQ